jgi:hypothetical protein
MELTRLEFKKKNNYENLKPIVWVVNLHLATIFAVLRLNEQLICIKKYVTYLYYNCDIIYIFIGIAIGSVPLIIIHHIQLRAFL